MTFNRLAAAFLLALACPASAATDDIDLPFQDDPSVVGTWRSVAFVSVPEQFDPEKGPAADLFLKEQVFLPQGRTPRPQQTWTRGFLLDPVSKTASKYDFKELGGLQYMFLEWKSGDYTIRDRKPEYYVLVRDADYEKVPKPKAAQTQPHVDFANCLVSVPPGGLCKHPAPDSRVFKTLKALPHYDSASDDQWQMDLRGQDLTEFDLLGRTQDLLYADFDTRTQFPGIIPEGYSPERIMDLGKDPGLGLRGLHKEGITGKGVSMAIIDHALLVEHQEYGPRLRTYEEVHWDSPFAGMHAGAVASFSVGKDCGVAPEADLYYVANWWAERQDVMNYAYLAKAIDHVLAVNEALPKEKRIRVLTIQRGFAPHEKGYGEVTGAIDRAKQAGIFVVTSSLSDHYGFRFNGLGREPLSDPDQPVSYGPGLWWQKGFYATGQGSSTQTLLVPMDSRTAASQAGGTDYVFYRHGGWSWSIPYIGGLYALACQVKPDVTPELFWKTALETGDAVTVKRKGGEYRLERIVNPRRLVMSLQGGVKTHDADGRRTIEELFKAHEGLAGNKDWSLETIHVDEGLPIRVLTTKKKGPAVWLLAGIHGEEPAPSEAVARNMDKLAALSAKGIPAVVFPLCNPVGYSKGWRYPDAAERRLGHSVGDSDYLLPDQAGKPRLPAAVSLQSQALTQKVLELAKDYPPVVSVDLHEDDSLPAGYIYSQGPKGCGDPAAKAVLAKMRELRYPVKLDGQTDFDEKIVGGVICDVNDGSMDELIAAKKVLSGGSEQEGPGGRSVIVVETSSMKMPLAQRAKLHSAIIGMLARLYELARK